MEHRAPLPRQLVGGWELGLLVLMAILFAVGFAINPAFFGSGDALLATLRDTARYAVMAVGMTASGAKMVLSMSSLMTPF